MIIDLLKQLCISSWQFCRYQLARVVGSNRATAATPATLQTGPVGGGGSSVATAAVAAEAILAEAYTVSMRLSTSRRDLDGEEHARNPVFKLWKQHKPRAHKWAHYFHAYHAIFDARRHEVLRILEIGVYQGASLRLWRQYFDNAQTVIVGIDINPNCARFDSPQDNIHVRIGSQSDAAFLNTITRDFGPFDIIIDDGSHISSHMIASFNHLFSSGMKDDGMYVAEDLHANYWSPWRDTPQSFLDLCKELMEYMHVYYSRASLDDWLKESESSSETNRLVLDVPAIATMIREIRVFDSIVAIQKTRREHLPRVISPLVD